MFFFVTFSFFQTILHLHFPLTMADNNHIPLDSLSSQYSYQFGEANSIAIPIAESED